MGRQRVECQRPVWDFLGRGQLAWQPGWQTVGERREESYDEHGWAAGPTRETLTQWAALQRAEDEHYSSKASASDYGSQAVGLAAGVGVAAAISLAPIDVPVAAVAAVGAAMTWAVADFGDSAAHEHWAEDIDNRGVVSGLVHGTGHVFSQTGSAIAHDVTDEGSAIGDGAKGLWHSVFG